jgi:hypothetical protein
LVYPVFFVEKTPSKETKILAKTFKLMDGLMILEFSIFSFRVVCLLSENLLELTAHGINLRLHLFSFIPEQERH